MLLVADVANQSFWNVFIVSAQYARLGLQFCKHVDWHTWGIQRGREKLHMELLLFGQPTTAPRTALRAARAAGNAKCFAKPQVQWLKKKLV